MNINEASMNINFIIKELTNLTSDSTIKDYVLAHKTKTIHDRDKSHNTKNCMHERTCVKPVYYAIQKDFSINFLQLHNSALL